MTDALLTAVGNLARFHREHEKYFSEAPLHDAIALQRTSRTLKALAERWSAGQPEERGPAVPFAGAPDLNDERAIETSGVLFMEGTDAPPELAVIRGQLETLAASSEQAGEWLAKAMEQSWAAAAGLLRYPELADLLGERHRIIANDWLNASHALLVARHLRRANEVLAQVDFTPEALRADIAGPRSAPAYLFSAAELIDRAADISAISATVVHDNERRWRAFRARIEVLERAQPAA